MIYSIKRKGKTLQRKVSSFLFDLQRDNGNPMILFLCLFVFSVVYRRNLIFPIPKESAINFEAQSIEKKILDALSEAKSRGRVFQPSTSDNLNIGDTELLFVNFHEEGTINFNVFNELYDSARHNNIDATILNLHGLEIDIQRNLINSHLRKSEKSKILFFEVHSDHILSKGVLTVDLLRHYHLVSSLVVAPICFDIWREFDLKYLEYWREVTTSFIHIDPISSQPLENEYPMVFWPFVFPSPTSDFENRRIQIDHVGHHILHTGAVHMASRIGPLVYLSFLSVKMGFSLHVRDRSKRVSNQLSAPCERVSYLKSLVSSNAVLDLNERGKNRVNLITFRALETIFQGGCLITQVRKDSIDSPLKKVAIPYLHYIPFSNALELGAICKVLKEKPHLANLIKDSCKEDFAERFRKSLWSRLFDSINDSLGVKN